MDHPRVTHPCATLLILADFLVRLACVKRAASVDSEPGSNSRLNRLSFPFRLLLRTLTKSLTYRPIRLSKISHPPKPIRKVSLPESASVNAGLESLFGARCLHRVLSPGRASANISRELEKICPRNADCYFSAVSIPYCKVNYCHSLLFRLAAHQSVYQTPPSVRNPFLSISATPPLGRTACNRV